MAADPMMPDTTSDVGSAPSSSSAPQLQDLQPDVLHNILHFLTNRDMACLCLTSRRLASNTVQACQHWAPKVEGWLLADPSRSHLLQRLRMSEPLTGHITSTGGLEHCCSASGPAPHDVAQQHASDAAAAFAKQQPAQHQDEHQGPITNCELQQRRCDQQLAAGQPATQPQLRKRTNWRQVWSCIQRAQQGPWQLDVHALTPAAAPNGVLLTFELLLQQPAPNLEPRTSEQQPVGARDSVTVIHFVLDRKTVEIIVDASGRVTSPQRDWCQGCIQLQPGQPRLLALEINYIMPVPAWFLHPCTLAAPRPCSSRDRSCCGSCASSMSGMTLDQTWDSYSTGTSGGCSSMSIGSSVTLCSAAAGAGADSCSLASSSLTSSGSLVTFAGAASSSSGSCTCCRGDGRPRLSLDLSCGFGTYVSDPRYIDAAHHKQPRGLERMELSSRVCWKPNKVQSWLGRLLPGIRSHSSSNAGSSSPRASGHAGSSTSSSNIAATAAYMPGNSVRPGAKPSFAVNLSKVAAWQVPSDTDRRFAEGFLFWAVQHKLEQLLTSYGVLQQDSNSHSCCTDSSVSSSTRACEACAHPAAKPLDDAQEPAVLI